MTRISYIHSVPQNEFADRGREYKGGDYLPYNSLTTGEAFLMLQRNRMQMLSRFYPESKELKQSVQMLDNALYQGISRGVSYIGAIPDELQQLANLITKASRATQPAVRGGFMGRSSIYNGIGEVVDLGDYNRRLKVCVARKGANPNAEKPKPYSSRATIEAYGKRLRAEGECKLRLEFEDLLNKSVTGMGHHMLYKNVDPEFNAINGSRVDTKRIFQRIGVDNCSQLAEFSDTTIMYEWLENGVLAKNIAGGVGPANSVKSSFALAPDPEVMWAEYIKNSPARAKWEKMNPGISGIGVLPLLTLLAPIILAAIKLASDFLSAARAKNSLAMATAQGFGSAELQSQTSDWNLPPAQSAGSGGLGIDQNTLMLGGAAVAAYLLLSDK